MSSQDATGNGHENNVNTNGSRSQSHSNIDLMSNDDSVNDASDNDNDEDDEYTSADEGTENYIPRATVESQTRKEKDLILLGQSLILNGEYLRCAHMLRKQGDSSSAPHAHTNTMKVRSAHGIFLATYSLYMAGEKLKDQQQVEKEGRENREAALANAANANNVLPGSAANKTKKAETQKVQTKNPFLGDIFKDLWPIYVSTNTHVPGGTEAGTGSDENGMNAVQPPTSSAEPDAFLLYMLAIIVRDLYSQQGGMLSMKHTIGVLAKAGLANRRNSDGNVNNPSPAAAAAAAVAVPTAYDLFLSSLRIYPWNWSCWQDLSQLCISSQIPIPVWDDVYKGGGSSREACHWIMYQHFLASFYLEQQNGDAALSSISTLAEWFPSSYTIVTYKALAHYALRDYDRAQECFEAARNVDPHQLAHVDTYSNILYVKERRAELSHLAHVVTKIDKFSAESCCVVGNYYSLKGKHERAITYFQRALRANPKFLPAWTLMGHECVELRNTAAAVQCYRNAVDLSPSDYRAWYGLGQTYEMLHLYQYSLYYYKKAAALKPSDARMWSAVGSQFVRLGAKKDAMRTFERAMNCGDSEGVATRELARLYRDEGRLEDAANCYVGYLQSCGEHHLITAALEMVEDNHRSLGGGGGGKGDIDASYSSKANTSHHSVLSQAAAFTVGGSANGMVQLDPERVEGALFLGKLGYWKNLSCVYAFICYPHLFFAVMLLYEYVCVLLYVITPILTPTLTREKNTSHLFFHWTCTTALHTCTCSQLLSLACRACKS